MSKNRVVHFEIPASDRKALTNFYTKLFGWKFQRAPIPGIEYWLCETGSDGPGIKRQNAGQPVTNYVDVANIDGALQTAVKVSA